MTMGAINEYTTNLKTSEFIRKSEFISTYVVFYLLDYSLINTLVKYCKKVF